MLFSWRKHWMFKIKQRSLIVITAMLPFQNSLTHTHTHTQTNFSLARLNMVMCAVECVCVCVGLVAPRRAPCLVKGLLCLCREGSCWRGHCPPLGPLTPDISALLPTLTPRPQLTNHRAPLPPSKGRREGRFTHISTHTHTHTLTDRHRYIVQSHTHAHTFSYTHCFSQ